MSRVSPAGAAELLEDGLSREEPRDEERQRLTIREISQCETWQLEYGGGPSTTAQQLRDFLLGRSRSESQVALRDTATAVVRPATRLDPLRRYVETPLAAVCQVMGRTIRVETNDPSILQHATAMLGSANGNGAGQPKFLWRIVSENTRDTQPPWPEMNSFSDGRLRYVNLGQRSFVAVDEEARLAVGRLPECRALDAVGLEGVFLPLLWYLSARGLGLSTLIASAVAEDGRALLVFGKPNSGKTTASYFAARMGLEFFADEALFLEFDGADLRAWGDFWPAKFRSDAAQHIPELASLTRLLNHYKLPRLCFARNAAARNRSARPIGCAVLERNEAATPRLVPVYGAEQERLLMAALPFGDDARPQDVDPSVWSALRALPMHRLQYGSDPAQAAPFLVELLRQGRGAEGRS